MSSTTVNTTSNSVDSRQQQLQHDNGFISEPSIIRNNVPDESLLRTWGDISLIVSDNNQQQQHPVLPPRSDNNNNHMNVNSNDLSNNTTRNRNVTDSITNSPPVAAATAMLMTDDNGEIRTSNNSAYPVATFLHDFVRTGIERAGVGGINRLEQYDEPLSVRSVPTTATTTSTNNSAARIQQEFHSARPPNNNNDLDENAEYILINGELIEMPHVREQEILEQQIRRQLQNDDDDGRITCKPATTQKIKKGVRGKLARLFRVGRKTSKEASGSGSSGTTAGTTNTVSNGPSPDPSYREINNGGIINPTNNNNSLEFHHTGTTDDAVLPMPAPIPNVDGQQPHQSNTNNVSPKRKGKKDNKKSRGGWGRGRHRNKTPDPDDEQQQQNEYNNVSSAAANAGEETQQPSTINNHTHLAYYKDQARSIDGSSNTTNNRGTRGEEPPVTDPIHENYVAAARGFRPPIIPPQDRALHNIGFSAMTGLDPPSTSQDRLQQYNQYVINPGLLNHAAAPPPPQVPIGFTNSSGSNNGSAGGRAQSVTASYIGPANAVSDIYLPPDTSVAAESFVEEEMDAADAAFLKKTDTDEPVLPFSLVAEHADLKVDKADTPDVEAMLRRALIETTTDLEVQQDSDCIPTSLPIPPDLLSSMIADDSAKPKGKVEDGVSVALTAALPQDPEVHNDTLKVVMVSASTVDKTWLARRLRNSNKRARKRTTLAVDVHEWRPMLSDSSTERCPVRCMIWDVQGATATEDQPNFGAHPGTQALFFSPQSLYLLVWDLGSRNEQINLRHHAYKDIDIDDDDDLDEEDDSDFEEDDQEDEFIREEAKRQADRALRADISNRVLSWFDCIAQRGPRSAILPVALIPEHMSASEVKRRCTMMQELLEDHVHNKYEIMRDEMAPKLLTGAENSVVCVQHYGEAVGIQPLQEMVMAIANDPSRSVFQHVGTPVPYGTVLVREAIEKFKIEHKLILLDHLMGELGTSLDMESMIGCLHFLASIGEILYFGTHDDEELSRYIILSRKWLISALSCILRNDLKRELQETRRFMNMQCLYSDEKYEENEITKTLVSGSSNCPLLSDSDAKMLWLNMNFMREASDRYANLVESATSAPTMFDFLERLLVHTGVFLPLGAYNNQNAALDQSEVYFVPSLLAQADPHNLWTYRSSESWITTLCHSWLFRDGAPPNLMEYVTVRVLGDLYEFSKTFHAVPPIPPRDQPNQNRVHSVPVGKTSFGEFLNQHDKDVVGSVRIYHAVAFKSSMLLKIGTIFAEAKTGELRESFVEVFIAVVDQNSSHAVASDVMRPSMQRLVVSGKGQLGHQGRKLWKGGYKVILDSVRNTLLNMSNIDSQVICPECLAHSSPRIASTWGWDSVLAVAESGNPHVICLRGHRVNSNLICGTCPERKPAPVIESQSQIRVPKIVNIREALPSVVLVGVWDADSKSIISIGSGFILDKKLGLVVTAAHVVFKMETGHKAFGLPYFGFQNARAIIGVLPHTEGKQAVFRYFADIVASDIQNVDACVLQIRSRLQRDVEDAEAVSAIDQTEKFLSIEDMPAEELMSLKMTKFFDLEESVRLAGYNQGGEGIYKKGKHISHSVDFVSGCICRHFKATMREDSFSSDSSTSNNRPQAFAPREEIVVMCSAISGHSGGPCLNNDGKVIGILSRSDPAERQRCYLVPATEIKPLISKAKTICARPERTVSSQTA